MIDFLYKAAAELQLGSTTEPPRRLTGGFMHRMYSLFTDRGRYAVKLLNPHIMARPDAPGNFRRAETLESRLEATGIPILPALFFSDSKMQQMGGQYFYVFDWFDGRALTGGEITEEHCRIIGAELAKIHQIDQKQTQSAGSEPTDIPWDKLISAFRDRNPELHALLLRNRRMLYETQDLANAAVCRLEPISAICHNDLDSKNVLWHGSECRIIDLECLDWSHPHLDLYETALYWSGIEQCRIDPNRFKAFLSAYTTHGGDLPEKLLDVHDANAGRLGWLEYNLRRAQGLGCSEDEIPTGVSESFKTIAQLVHYREIRDNLLS